MAYRATIHDSTGYTPHNIIFGRELICSCDIIAGFSLKNGAPRCPVQYVEWVNQTIKLTYEFVNQNLQRTAMSQKKNYDRGVNLPRPVGSFYMWFPFKIFLRVSFIIRYFIFNAI
jgi:hypothetical protein